ncbi:MAG: hypothetical protein ACP5NV_06490 [Candidatus Woesearchaeota archaeon]
MKQEKGIKIIAPSTENAAAYIARAEADLLVIQKQDQIWAAIISYYACYNALYAVLQRYGIKSEIHSCTIEIMDYFNKLKPYKQFMIRLRNIRQDVQYYLKEPANIDYNEIRTFISCCKIEIRECNNDKISTLHKILSQT